MLKVLNMSEEGYIPELGCGFEAGENTQGAGLEVAGFALPAQGPGVYHLIYRVEVKEDVESLFIFAGRKQLLFCGSRKAGEKVEGECYVHLSEIIPRFHEEPARTEAIGFAVACGKLDSLGEISANALKLRNDTGIPVVWLAGDSTVTDQPAQVPYQPGGCYSSWGQDLSCFLGGSAAVDNVARSGLTTETFREEGHYAIVQKYIRPGDFCLFQFGHNDQKLAHLQAQTGYRENLLRFIDEIRGKNAIPVLVTPLSRNTWREDASYNDLLAEHAEAVIGLGELTGVPVLDLHRFSMDLIRQKGKEASRVYFHPGDMTHTNEYGSWLFASFIAKGLRDLDEKMFEITGLDRPLLPDDAAGQLTAAAGAGVLGEGQKEIFDAMERAGDSLVEAVEKARKEAQMSKES